MNWLAIIVAVLASAVIGFIWYNPKVFGNAWMKSIGITMDDAKDTNVAKMMIVDLAMATIVSINSARFMGYPATEYMTIKHGIFHGLESLGYLVVPVIVTTAIYEKRNFKYIAITVGY
ncbi:MAG: DUF1761 domain-containing protein [Flavobacteriales bacterium]|nr:DUF1761 domain-containing protein [Flavobacteriales bacterium]